MHFLRLLDSKNRPDQESVAFFEASRQQKRAGPRDCFLQTKTIWTPLLPNPGGRMKSLDTISHNLWVCRVFVRPPKTGTPPKRTHPAPHFSLSFLTPSMYPAKPGLTCTDLPQFSSIDYHPFHIPFFTALFTGSIPRSWD